MGENNTQEISITSISYIFDEKEIAAEQLPDEGVYVVNHYGANEELVYCEWRTKRKIHRIIAYPGKTPFQEFATSLFEKVKTLEPSISLHQLELDVVIPIEEFAVNLAVDDSESCQIMAVFLAEDQQPAPASQEQTFMELAENYSPNNVLGPLQGYIVDVHTDTPVRMNVKQLQFSQDKQPISAVYALHSMGENQDLVIRYSFVESSDDSLTGEEQQDAGMSDVHPFPCITEEQLKQDQQILHADKLAVIDLEGRPLNMADTAKHPNYIRQWVNADELPMFFEVFLEGGLASTEILDIPQPMHRRVLHAYLRRIHTHRELISLHHDAAHYVHMHEPFNQESSEVVPLEPGQIKRHTSIFTIQGVRVACQCHVFDSNMRPLRAYSFAGPHEEHLMSEEIFKYDAQGKMLESEHVNHLNS